MFTILMARIRSQVKARIALAAKSAACSLITVAAVVAASCFFVAAGVVWLADRYGTIEACLMAGGAFMLVAVLAVVALVVIRRRSPAPVSIVTGVQDFVDPQSRAMGAEIMRLFGGRRAATLGLIGAFAVGLLLSRTVVKK